MLMTSILNRVLCQALQHEAKHNSWLWSNKQAVLLPRVWNMMKH